jgi:hypothetical protein
MNFFDQQLAISGGTLHHIGLLMQAEEAAAARSPKDAARPALPGSLFLGASGIREQSLSSVQSVAPLVDVQGRYSPTEVNTYLAGCAWCAAEAGIKPDSNMNQSHGICERHLAAIKADLERRAA